MAKKETEHKAEEGKPKKRLHLHEIRSTYARDGSVTHHHTYKDHIDHAYTHPERGPMATSPSPEEAGQHVAEQFAMNQPGGGEQPAPEGGEDAGGAAQAAPMMGA